MLLKNTNITYMVHESFHKHLKEAIKINQARRQYYAQQTKGYSKSLSNRLIFFEKILLPVATQIEKKAEKFNKQGIPIIQEDFISMKQIKPVETPPIYTNIAPKETAKTIQRHLNNYKKKCKNALKQNNLQNIIEASQTIFHQIEQIEETHQCHFAMTKHLIESLGYQAIQGKKYNQQSKGTTLKLSKQMIHLHLMGISFLLLSFDKKAQKCHQLGIGIILNDVPTIPLK